MPQTKKRLAYLEETALSALSGALFLLAKLHIPLIHDLVLLPLQKIAQPRCATHHKVCNFPLNSQLFLRIEGFIILGKAGFPLPADQKKELDLQQEKTSNG
jgi:hypothetical protein